MGAFTYCAKYPQCSNILAYFPRKDDAYYMFLYVERCFNQIHLGAVIRCEREYLLVNLENSLCSRPLVVASKVNKLNSNETSI